MSEPRPQASWWEILGAWLRVWTPPRDVEIPSPRIAIVAAVVVVGAGTVAVVTLVAPAIDRAKDRDAARAAQATSAFRAAEEKRLAIQQRARHGRAVAVGRMWAGGRRDGAMAALVASAQTNIARDARARVAARELSGRIRRVSCTPRERDRGERVHLECVAVTGEHRHRGILAQTGHPFLVGASLRSGRYAWCKDNPGSAEGTYGKSVQVRLPAACAD